MSKRDLIAAFAAPAVAVIAVGVSASLASGAGYDARPAYGPTMESLSEQMLGEHAGAVFARADLDASGHLDADEYAALALVTAEMSRLNGFYALETGGEADVIALPVSDEPSLTSAERVRIDAVARGDFYNAAGDDLRLTEDEFAAAQKARFAEADRDGDGALARTELTSFAARAAMVRGSDA